jgi:hypothetical protein
MRLTKTNRELIRLYLRERKQGTLARWALRNAKTRMEWDKKNGQIVGEYERHHEAKRGDVRLRIVADESIDLDNLFGDTFNPDVNTDIHPQRLERERQAEIDRVNRDGVWGIVGEFFDGEEWQHADSCFGFIGEDWKDSGYDTNIMASTLEQAKNTRVCRACKRPLKQEVYRAS